MKIKLLNPAHRKRAKRYQQAYFKRQIMKKTSIITFTIMACLTGCSDSQTDRSTASCIPYFQYDKVDHYYLDIDERNVNEKFNRSDLSDKEDKLLFILVKDQPIELSDNNTIENLTEQNFIKKTIPDSKFDKLNEIFCERKHNESYSTACILIYRDILVFKKKDKVVGTAKICFDCDQSVIEGTDRNTEEFGQSGDFEKLYRLIR